jgi:hypothetical protein
MSYKDEENQKQPVTNNHLKHLFGLDDDYQPCYFEEIQRKYWENLKAANDNIEVKRGDNE